MLKEIKRITGEENSGMEFTVDSLESNCEHLDEKAKTDCDQHKNKEQ